MNNCLKLDTCEKVLRLKSQDIMDWQLTKAREEMCGSCPLFEPDNIDEVKKIELWEICQEVRIGNMSEDKAVKEICELFEIGSNAQTGRGVISNANDRLLLDEDILFYTEKSEFSKGGVGFTLRTFLETRSLHYPKAIREYVEYIKKAQLAKVQKFEQARVERIFKEIEGFLISLRFIHYSQLMAFLEALKKQEAIE